MSDHSEGKAAGLFPPKSRYRKVSAVLLTKDTLKSFPHIMTSLAKGRPMQADDFNWPELKDLIVINRIHVEATREPFAVVDRSRLEAAVLRPQLAYYNKNLKDTLHLAVSMMIAVCEANAFAQGNKRTAFSSARLMLVSNGYDIDPRIDSARNSKGQPKMAVLLKNLDKSPDAAKLVEQFLRPYVFEIPKESDETLPCFTDVTVAPTAQALELAKDARLSAQTAAE